MDSNHISLFDDNCFVESCWAYQQSRPLLFFICVSLAQDLYIYFFLACLLSCPKPYISLLTSFYLNSPSGMLLTFLWMLIFILYMKPKLINLLVFELKGNKLNPLFVISWYLGLCWGGGKIILWGETSLNSPGSKGTACCTGKGHLQNCFLLA